MSEENSKPEEENVAAQQPDSSSNESESPTATESSNPTESSTATEPPSEPAPEHTSGTSSSNENLKLTTSKSLSAEAGWQWIADGFDIFKREPGLFIGMFIVMAVILGISSIIPFVGTIIMPIFSGGFMYFCHKVSQGEKGDFEDLFYGFKSRLTPLAIIGLINMAALWIIGFVVIAIVGVGAGLGTIGGQEGTIAGMLIGLLFGLMVTCILYIPVAMGLWFAPALVMFHPDVKPMDAVIMSFKACLKNIVPFIIYSIIVLIMMMIAAIPAFLGYLVAIPVLIGSTYAGYRSIFTE